MPKIFLRSSLKTPFTSAKRQQLPGWDARWAGEQRLSVLLNLDRGADLGLPSVAARPQALAERALDRLNSAFRQLYGAEGRPLFFLSSSCGSRCCSRSIESALSDCCWKSSRMNCCFVGLWIWGPMIRSGLWTLSLLTMLQVKCGRVTTVLVVCWMNRLWDASWRCWWVGPRFNMLLCHVHVSVDGSLLQAWMPLDFTCKKQLSWSGISPGCSGYRQLKWSLCVSMSGSWRLEDIIYDFIRSLGSTCMQ